MINSNIFADFLKPIILLLIFFLIIIALFSYFIGYTSGYNKRSDMQRAFDCRSINYNKPLGGLSSDCYKYLKTLLDYPESSRTVAI